MASGDFMSIPNSRNWKAVEQKNPTGGGYLVQVTGEVEASTPTLQARVPQGLEPRILMLDLSKVDDGSGYETVEYRHPSEVNAYEDVDIFYLGQEVARIRVEQSETITSQAGSKGARKQTKPARKKAGKTKATKKMEAKKKTKKAAKKRRARPAKKKRKKKSLTKGRRKKRL
jgi:hypothetical protein